MKKLRLPCNFSKFSNDEEDSRLMKCELKIQHDLDNVNNSYFDLEDIKTAANNSLRRTPILGSVIYDEDSEEYKLNGHDMTYKIIKSEDGYELKVSHIERIYGFIADDAEFSYVYDEEKEKNYLVTTGYLWRNYLDEVEDILNRNDGSTDISMEISVNESFVREDKLTQITDYVFEGITMLGVPPGMVGAKLELFSNINVSDIKLQMEELCKVYALEKEEKNLEENKKYFGLSVENLTDQLRTQVNSKLIKTTDYWGDEYEHQEFYFITLLPEENIAVVEDYDWRKRQAYGVPYSKNEDVLSLDFENKKPYLCEWREMNGAAPNPIELDYSLYEKHIMDKFNSIDTHDSEVEELNNLKTSYSELEAKFNAMDDYQELKEFKATYDNAKYESEIEEISNMFSLDIEEYSDLKDKVLSREISKDQYQEKLALKQFMKDRHEKVDKKFEKESVSSEIQIINDITDKKARPYGGAFDKYLNK